MRRPPLELLHPDGSVRGVVVHGSGRVSGLVSPPEATSEPIDLAVLAPTRMERSSRSWLERAAAVASSVARDGLVVAINPSRRLRAELRALDLRPALQLLHVPDVARSRFLVPLGGDAARYATRQLIDLKPAKRAAVRAIGLPVVAWFAPTSTIFGRPDARPALQWLSTLSPALVPARTIVAPSWRPGSATVLHCFADRATPEMIVKLGPGAKREAAVLGSLAAAAGNAGADVPGLVGARALAGVPMVLESAVKGKPAVGLLRGSSQRVRALLPAVATWLAAWNRATAVQRAFGPDEAELHLLGPARRIAPILGDDHGYLAELERLCSVCSGKEIPLVAAHNDLTAANVLVGEHGRLGVVDWEGAAPACFPLGDLAYATADFAAAVDGYRDRASGYQACFRTQGAFSGLADELLAKAAAALELDEQMIELCLQACWLRHADDERREPDTHDSDARPFLEILRYAAARLGA